MSVIITAENMLFMDKFTLVANNLHCRRQWQISPLLWGLWKGTLACLFLTLFKWAKKCTNHPCADPHKTRNRPSGQQVQQTIPASVSTPQRAMPIWTDHISKGASNQPRNKGPLQAKGLAKIKFVSVGKTIITHFKTCSENFEVLMRS